MTDLLVSISVVSHRQGALVKQLLYDLEGHCNTRIAVIVTVNVEESLPFAANDFKFPVTIIANRVRKGFGANHNSAFRQANGRFFCVINPDIRILVDPFPELLRGLETSDDGAVGPLVVNSQGAIEDSARRFPTPLRVVYRAIGRRECPSGSDDPDWIAGMFMVFLSTVFERIQGFNERYFLYYEDVDLCARLRLVGYNIRQCKSVRVVHEARRQSHRELRYFKWHLVSMLRFFGSQVFMRTLWRRWNKAGRK